MPDYELLWSAPAIDDLVRIRDHIAAEGRPMAARRLARRIRSGVEVLADHPRLGRVVPEFEGAGYREVIVAPYRIVYELSGNGWSFSASGTAAAI